MTVVLRTRELDVGYGNRTVLRQVDLEMLRGQFVGILGPNGCGKSTLLRTIARALSPLRGMVYLKGERLTRLRQTVLAQQMAVVLTERTSPGLLTVFDVVALGRYPHTGFMGKLSDQDQEQVWEALALVDAGHLASRFFTELSDGEAQKVLIARALAQNPELMVLDEPTSHLDARHRVEVMRILRRLVATRGLTVLAAMHDVDLSLKVCDLVLLIGQGGVMGFGTPEEVLTAEAVAQLYGIKDAEYSSHLGGIEFRCPEHTQVFVVAGSGTGTPLYRALAKHQFGIATGVLAQNDIDFHVAVATGASVVGESPYHPISEDSFHKALERACASFAVVDAGFPVAETNQRNVDLIAQAVALGKVTYTLRPTQEVAARYGALAGRVRCCSSMSMLLRMLRDVHSPLACGACV